METKKCNRCEEEKSLSEFLFRNKENGTYHSACRICYKEIRKNSYNNNKSSALEKNRRNSAKNRVWFNNLKGSLKCERCDENHPATLDFHHINPNEKDNNIGNLIGTYSQEKVQIEIAKCIVLCSNCHRKEHYNSSIV